MRTHGELRLTLADPCEAPLCPLDAALTVVDKHSKPWRVCADHVKYFAKELDHGHETDWTAVAFDDVDE